MRLHAILVLLAILSALLLVPVFAGTDYEGSRKNVTLMFFRPVTQEDLSYLRAMGGEIKYTCSAVNGVGVTMTEAALGKLMTMYQNPSAPLSDSIARNISFIADDGMAYPFDSYGAAARRPEATVQPVPGRGLQTTAVPIGSASGILPDRLFAFPIMSSDAHI
jgi:hypothetical protein